MVWGLLPLLCFVSSAAKAEEKEYLGYHLEPGQEFWVLTAIHQKSLPTPDAPEGVKQRQDVVMWFKVLSVNDRHEADVQATLSHLSVASFVRGQWMQMEDGAGIPDTDRQLKIVMLPTGETRHIPSPQEESFVLPAGSLDLPALPAADTIAGGTWETRDDIGRINVEGTLQRYSMGRLDRIEKQGENKTAHIHFTDTIEGADLPVHAQETGMESIELRTTIVKSHESIERDMVFDLNAGFPHTIDAISDKSESMQATVLIDNVVQGGNTPREMKIRSDSRTRFLTGEQKLEELLKMLQEDAFFQAE